MGRAVLTGAAAFALGELLRCGREPAVHFRPSRTSPGHRPVNPSVHNYRITITGNPIISEPDKWPGHHNDSYGVAMFTEIAVQGRTTVGNQRAGGKLVESGRAGSALMKVVAECWAAP